MFLFILFTYNTCMCVRAVKIVQDKILFSDKKRLKKYYLVMIFLRKADGFFCMCKTRCNRNPKQGGWLMNMHSIDGLMNAGWIYFTSHMSTWHNLSYHQFIRVATSYIFFSFNLNHLKLKYLYLMTQHQNHYAFNEITLERSITL